jgi:glycosyltransferase involved in cell wall biosynthesis
MKRLLLCSMSVPWPARPRLCAYHIAQARALRDLDVSMDLFSPAPALPAWSARLHPKLRAHVERPERYEIDDVTIHSPRCIFAFPQLAREVGAALTPRLLGASARLALGRAVLRTIRQVRPDGILAHAMMPWGDVLRRASEEAGLPFAVIEHSAEDVLRLRRRTPLGQFYRRSARRARAVFAVGPPMVEHLRGELGLTNVRHLPNGTHLPDAATLRRPRPRELQDRPLLLSAGHYYQRKGFEILVDAFADLAVRHPRAILHIVTNAPASLRERARARGLGDRLRFVPPMDQDRLHQWMAWSDLFVLPSWSEAFALVGIEAMAAGTPVVVTSDCGLSRMIDPVRPDEADPSRHGWVVEPRSPDALVAAMTQALQAPEMLPRMGAAGRELAVQRFNWRRNARTILGAFDGVVSAGRCA